MEAPEDLIDTNDNAMDIEETPQIINQEGFESNPTFDQPVNVEPIMPVNQVQLNPEIEQERQALKENIKKFLTINNVYNMMPSNSEVIAIDDLASLHDLLYVLTSNQTNSVLCWSSDKKIIDGIFVSSDFSNFLINFNDDIIKNFIKQSPNCIQNQQKNEVDINTNESEMMVEKFEKSEPSGKSQNKQMTEKQRSYNNL